MAISSKIGLKKVAVYNMLIFWSIAIITLK